MAGDSRICFGLRAPGALNTVAQVDTDFDGVGDGAIITDTFTQFIAAISGTGSSLDLLVEISLERSRRRHRL